MLTVGNGFSFLLVGEVTFNHVGNYTISSGNAYGQNHTNLLLRIEGIGGVLYNQACCQRLYLYMVH